MWSIIRGNGWPGKEREGYLYSILYTKDNPRYFTNILKMFKMFMWSNINTIFIICKITETKVE